MEEILSLIKILAHQQKVAYHLRQIARELEHRADIHDLSKFSPDEFAGFCQLDAGRNQQKEEYGSKGYEDGIKNIDAVKLHWSRNHHHPEHWPGGMSDMSFGDIIEMLCDWEVARVERDTEEDINKTWQMRQKRFKLSDDEIKTLRYIWEKIRI